jgi:hypothetical protein
MAIETGTIKELLDRGKGNLPRILNVVTKKKYPPVRLFLADEVICENGGIVVKGVYVDFANRAELNHDTEVVLLLR